MYRLYYSTPTILFHEKPYPCDIISLSGGLMKRNLFEKMKHTDLLKGAEAIVVGMSGGVDSSVLFHLLKRLNTRLVIAHVNYHMRGASDDEAFSLKQSAEAENVPFEQHDVTHSIKGNFQEEARRIRFNFFTQVAEKYGAEFIALGHHLDDQIETFFMRLIKGSPFESLAGMASLQPLDEKYQIVRPLLEISKEELEAYAQKNGISYSYDVSNESTTYTRNRFRHHILPLLKKENPALEKTVSRHMQDITDIEGIIDAKAAALLERYGHEVPVEKFLSWPRVIQKAVFKKLLATHEIRFTTGLYEELLKQLQSGKNFVYPLSGYEIRREYDTFSIGKTDRRPSLYLRVETAGTYWINDEEGFYFTYQKNAHNTSKSCKLWYNDVVFPLEIRNRRDGDRIKLKAGEKKLKDLLIDMKIPPSRRDTLVLITSGEDILWIPDLDIIAEQAKAAQAIYIHRVHRAASDEQAK